MLVRISYPRHATLTSLGVTFDSYSTFCDAYFSSLPSFWMTEKSITWSNGHRSVTDRPDPAIEMIRSLPDPLEIRRVVLVDEELEVLGPVGAVGIAQHGEGVGGRNVVARGHQLGDLLLLALAA